MSVVKLQGSGGNNSKQTVTVSSLLARLLFLFVFDAASIWFFINTFSNEAYFLAITVAIVTVLFNVVFLLDRFYPVRWLMVGFGFMILFVIYPILFTVSTASTASRRIASRASRMDARSVTTVALVSAASR